MGWSDDENVENETLREPAAGLWPGRAMVLEADEDGGQPPAADDVDNFLIGKADACGGDTEVSTAVNCWRRRCIVGS